MAAAAAPRQVPGTPRVISPSPDLSDSSSQGDYFAPITRSAARHQRLKTPPVINEDGDIDEASEQETRARSRSRSVDAKARRRRMSGLDQNRADGSLQMTPGSATRHRRKSSTKIVGTTTSPPSLNDVVNGYLSPASAAKYYWRELSRSPSPLGLIPIHREWRSFIHRHEVPRKILHISIGFITLSLYAAGMQSSAIHPVLLAFLIPVAATDLLRHNWPAFNRFYIRALGALMRESEAHDKYNGVIWYLLGCWAVLRFCSKDIAAVSIVLLSWCDTAASTFGRLWGRYTPRIRRGKSMAGSIAAFVVGVASAAMFWGFIGPHFESIGVADNTGINAFSYTGRLALPSTVSKWLGLTSTQTTISGHLALGVMSIWTGLVASMSEAVDIFGIDDNVTIPILCGVGLWGFLKVFGSA